MTLEVVTTFADARALSSGPVGLVPTMGFLHEGHLSLVEAARSVTETVVMSLFVNPLQFDDMEDLERYPRDLARDAALAAEAGVDVLFAPSGAEMYPLPPATRVTVAGLTEGMEGAHRPGHFEGVATVVAKLFAGLRPDRAYFGRKDAQQLAVVSRMAADLSFPVDVVGVSTVREADGLALSSRNTRLAPDDRRVAAAVSRGLFRAADAAEGGERAAAALSGLVSDTLEEQGIVAEYVALVDRTGLAPLELLDRDAFLAVAARVGGVRLIDNVHFDVSAAGEVTSDRGTPLTGPSVLHT